MWEAGGKPVGGAKGESRRRGWQSGRAGWVPGAMPGASDLLLQCVCAVRARHACVCVRVVCAAAQEAACSVLLAAAATKPAVTAAEVRRRTTHILPRA